MTTKDFKSIFLAAGCFWGVEAYFLQLKGVINTGVGYAQGHVDDPTYRQVCTGKTGHTETAMVLYDPLVITLEEILDHYFRIINPYVLNRQGNDIGSQYRTGIYYDNDDNLETIQNFIAEKQKESDKKIVVEVEELKSFWRAEEDHQRYLENNPNGYCHIDMGLANEDEIKEDLIPEFKGFN